MPKLPAEQPNLAVFHAAQALIFERTGRVAKTHRGLHAQFSRLTHGNSTLGDELSAFLSRAYNFKAVADYEIGPDATVPLADAVAAIETAANFVSRVAAALAAES